MTQAKRSITISGHATSVALEPAIWDVIDRHIKAQDMALAAFMAKQDEARALADYDGGLASWLRVWVVKKLQQD